MARENKLLNLLYSLFFIPGLLTGIHISTGVDVSETGIAKLLINTICHNLTSTLVNQTTTTQISTICWEANFLLWLVDIFGILGVVIVAIKNPIIGILGAFFWLSGLLIVFSKTAVIGGILFAVLLFITQLIEEHGPAIL